MVQGQLSFKNRLMLPKNSTFIPLILREFNDIVVGDQARFLKSYKRIAVSTCWEGMKGDIDGYLVRCLVCQQNKYMALFPGESTPAFAYSQLLWEEILMDFVEGLSK